jgi:hypothetical protein
MIELPRRRFLQCLVGLVAAPAVIKADSLMRVFAPKKLTPGPIYSFGIDIGAERSIWLVSWGEKTIFDKFPDISPEEQRRIVFGPFADLKEFA